MKKWALWPKNFSKLTLMSKKLKNKFSHHSISINALFLGILIGFTFISCGDTVDAPDVSAIEVDVDIIRYDQLFQNMDTLQIEASLGTLEQQYPLFTPLFYTRILPLSNPQNPADKVQLGENISKYIKDEFAQNLYDTVQIVYPHLEDVKVDLEEALKYLKYYFPKTGNYNVYAFISEFGFQTFITDDQNGKEGLGLGLDMFLGADYPYKALVTKNAIFSDYITRSFNKEHIVKKLLDAIIDDLSAGSMGERLLDRIIATGKKQYILDKAMPYTSDTIKWEYNKAQMDWVINNEANIYVHILDQELLYETKSKKIKSLVDLSPNSKGMPKEAPGRTANYTGYKIVEKFMSRTNISLDSLLRIPDAQYILDNSRYNPLNKG